MFRPTSRSTPQGTPQRPGKKVRRPANSPLRLESLEPRCLLAPVANADIAATHLNAAVALDYLLANDTADAGYTLSITGVTTPSRGTVSLNGNTVTYTPTTGLVGPDAFNYTISDGHGGTATGSVDMVVNQVIDQAAARTAILSGVTTMAITGSPGEIAVFGDQAFGVMHDGSYRPMAAAAGWGTGRIVAYGHNGYLNFNSFVSDTSTSQLFVNSVTWASQVAGTGAQVVTNNTSARDFLQAKGFTVTYNTSWENYLSGKNLLIVELASSVSTARQTAVKNFVRGGGGLITGWTGWGYASLGTDLKTMAGNVLLRQAGLGAADGIRSGTTTVTNLSTSLSNAATAIATVQSYWATGTPAMTQAQKDEAGEAIATALTCLPTTDGTYQKIASVYRGREASITPSPGTPISDSLDQSVLMFETQELLATPASQVVAHRSAGEFGTISPAPRG